MVGVIIVTHGQVGLEMLRTAQEIVGRIERAEGPRVVTGALRSHPEAGVGGSDCIAERSNPAASILRL